MPRRISSPCMRKMFSAPADATATKEQGDQVSCNIRGEALQAATIAFRPSATKQEAETGMNSSLLESRLGGRGLLALGLLMATLRDWFMICQERVPNVWPC